MRAPSQHGASHSADNPEANDPALGDRQPSEPDERLQYLLRREPLLDQNRGLAAYYLRVLWPGQSNASDSISAPGAASGFMSNTTASSAPINATGSTSAPGVSAMPDAAELPENDSGTRESTAWSTLLTPYAKALATSARLHGPNALFGFLPHWIDGSTGLLQSPFALKLPRNRVYIEFPPELPITPELIRLLQNLAHSGMRFSIRGDLAALPERKDLLPFCNAARFDSRHSTRAEIFRQSLQFKQNKRLLIGANVPDQASLENHIMLGFTLFQGEWPAKPIATATLSARQKTLLQLLTLIMGDGEIPDIEASLRQDKDLVQTLLNMVNTPAYGFEQEITSLNQAIMLLGRRHLQRWIQALIYTESDRPAGHLSPHMIMALARAHLMERVSLVTHPEQPVRAEAAFSTGILSLIEMIFGGTMQELLEQFRVDVPVRRALLYLQGDLGADLHLARLVFPSDRDVAEDPGPLLQEMGLQASQVEPLIQEAFTWAHSLAQSAS